MNPSNSNNYQGGARPGKITALAIALSIAFHAALLMGSKEPHKPAKPGRPAAPDPLPPFEIVDLKDTPEPPDLPKALDDPPPTVAVPTLPDVPVVSLPTDITQEIIPPLPSTDTVHNLVGIPTNIRHKLDGTGMPNLFNPGDLDKKPEPITRPSPAFPYELQREVSEGTVVVGFVVDSRGDVIQIHIVSSSHPGFERSALTAIQKWKFKPGIKDGRKVNTRVEQLLSFVIKDDR